MRSDENILQRLDAPTKAPAWPVGSEGNVLSGRSFCFSYVIVSLFTCIEAQNSFPYHTFSAESSDF